MRADHEGLPGGSASAPSHRSARRLLVDPHFGGVFWGKFTSFVAVMVHALVVSVLAFEATGSAVAVALATGAMFAPQLLLAPWSGALADRGYDVVQIIGGRLLSGVGAAVLGVWGLLADLDGWTGVLVISVTTTLSGVGLAIDGAAMQSIVPRLVSREEMPVAMALNTIPVTISRVAGPVLGAGLLATWGPAAALWAVAAGHAILGLVLLAVRVPAAPRRPASAGGSVVASVRYVRGDRPLLLLLVAVVVVGFAIEPIQTLSPAVAETFGDLHGEGATTVGLLVGAFGIGAGAGAVIAVVVGGRADMARQALAGLLLLVAGLAVAAVVDGFVLTCVGFAVVGSGFSVAMAGVNTLVQLRVPEELRGRVMALWMMALVGSRPVAALVVGLLADHAGLHPALVVTAVVVLIGAVLCRPSRLA